MIRNPRVWLTIAGVWLIALGVAHMTAHVSTFVLEDGMIGLREFAMNAMKQAYSTDPLAPSMWTLFRMLSVAFGLLLLFAGAANLVLVRAGARVHTIRAFALFGTVFWTLAFIPFAFIDPVIQPIVAAVVAVPLHGIAYVTAAAWPGDID